ncbi:MAG: pyridoxamine 5'-phosphate oxidase family protein [Campylobacterota bacterium]|nr:pyridoxamine 5'-phosphate oxidase family protein [Campylobacterota bacterium]
MDAVLEKIEEFVSEHHLLTLSTSHKNMPHACSAFYIFDKERVSFVIASDYETQHIKNVQLNSQVSVTVALETESIGIIQGLQCQAVMRKSDNMLHKKAYYKRFPYAAAMNPILWEIKVGEMKFTNNRLGFGKKLIWKR